MKSNFIFTFYGIFIILGIILSKLLLILVFIGIFEYILELFRHPIGTQDGRKAFKIKLVCPIQHWSYRKFI